MIEVQNVSKSYGDFTALNKVNFTIKAGEIVGLLGHNGAGKTTTLKILTGYLQPDEGSVSIDGKDVLTETQATQEVIGYLPENAPLYPELSVQDYLQMVANARKIPNKQRKEYIREAVLATGLYEKLTSPISTLSKGYRQRVCLAQAILHKPRLLILDEPTVGLDPTQLIEIRNLIKSLAKHSTILFSTHILSEVEALCDRAIILLNGEIGSDARLAELASSSDVVLELQKDTPDALRTLKTLNGVSKVEKLPLNNERVTYHITGKKNADLTPEIFELAKENNWPLRELKSSTRTLETVFSELAQNLVA